MELTHGLSDGRATITQAAILALALALSARAEAHDLDCHEMPVSQAEKLGCCGAGDAHFADASQFYEDLDGFGTISSLARTSASSTERRKT